MDENVEAAMIFVKQVETEEKIEFIPEKTNAF